MLPASHIYLALRSPSSPSDDVTLAQFLGGSVAPDIRYLQPDLTRQQTHSLAVGVNLSGSFGEGYRHHLRVDQVFYRMCESDPYLLRLGPTKAAFLAELHALRHLPKVQIFTVIPAELVAAIPGLESQTVTKYAETVNAYMRQRDPELGMALLDPRLRERAKNYITMWRRWGWLLKGIAAIQGSRWARLFDVIHRELES